MTPLTNRKSKVWSVVRVSSGNFLEMYDFMVFGYYAYWQCLFPWWQSIRILDVVAHDLRCGFSDAAPRSHCSWGIHRSPWASRRSYSDVGIDVDRHHLDSVRARIQNHRTIVSTAFANRPPASGFFGRYGIGRRLALFG